MKKLFVLWIFISASNIGFAFPIVSQDKYQELEKNLLCQGTLNLKGMRNLILSMNGHNPFNRSKDYMGSYTIPYGFQILNQPVREFNITKIWNREYSGFHYAYMTPIPGISPSEAAQLLNIPQNMETKTYQKGNLSVNVANGQTVLICHKILLGN